MAYLLSLIVNGVTILQNETHGTNIYADKHIKNNSDDNHILLGGGGHIDKGNFALANHGVHWEGFTKRATSSATWGTLISRNGYTPLFWLDSTSGGGVAFSDKSAQTSMQIDGFFYQNEGNKRVLDVSDFKDFSGGGISSSGNNLTQANHSITIGGVTKTAGSSTASIINSLSVSKLESSPSTNLTAAITINGKASADKTINFLWATALTNTSVSDPAKAVNDTNKQALQWFSSVISNDRYAGNNYGFPVNNNANGILYLGTHYISTTTNYYGGQLGVSSNGRLYYRFNNGGAWSTAANGGSWNTIAWTSDNVESASKLKTPRTIWGQNFDGTANVSGAISNTGTITPSSTHTYNIGSSSLVYERMYTRYIDTDNNYYLRLCAWGTEMITATNSYVGIKNTNPAYTLDVAGTIRATVAFNANGKAVIDSTGRFVPANTSYRNAGVYGIYDSYKVSHIWSMGTAYSISADGSSTNNLYGLAYFHTNWSNSATYNKDDKTEVSTYAGGHQIAMVNSGKVYASLGTYVWSRGGFIKNGSNDNYVLLGGGGHKALNSLNAGTLNGLSSTAFMRAVSDGTYYGMQDPAASTSNWIRTTSNGLLPNHSGGASALGTSSWPFSTAYIDSIYGKLITTSGGAGSTSISYANAAIMVGTKNRSSTTGSYYPGIAFNHMYTYNNGSSYRNHVHAWIGLKLHSTPGAELSYLVFATNGNTSTGSAPVERMSIAPNGNISCTNNITAAAFYESSDIRLKQNVKQLFTYSNIPQIKEFDWKDSGKHSYGLIAQDLESMGYPELVDIKDDGYKSVNYTAAHSLIIGKLQLKIKELEDRIKYLESK